MLHDYIDVTYFYLQNDYLKDQKLKFAIVFNHQQAHFELWLLGQTKNVQVSNWKKLKGSKWVTGEVMPKYSIFEIVLLPSPDFENYTKLSKSIHAAWHFWFAESRFMRHSLLNAALCFLRLKNYLKYGNSNINFAYFLRSRRLGNRLRCICI